MQKYITEIIKYRQNKTIANFLKMERFSSTVVHRLKKIWHQTIPILKPLEIDKA